MYLFAKHSNKGHTFFSSFIPPWGRFTTTSLFRIGIGFVCSKDKMDLKEIILCDKTEKALLLVTVATFIIFKQFLL